MHQLFIICCILGFSIKFFNMQSVISCIFVMTFFIWIVNFNINNKVLIHHRHTHTTIQLKKIIEPGILVIIKSTKKVRTHEANTKFSITIFYTFMTDNLVSSFVTTIIYFVLNIAWIYQFLVGCDVNIIILHEMQLSLII